MVGVVDGEDDVFVFIVAGVMSINAQGQDMGGGRRRQVHQKTSIKMQERRGRIVPTASLSVTERVKEGGARQKVRWMSLHRRQSYLQVPVACSSPAAGQVVGCRGSLRLGEALGPQKAPQFLRVEPAACGNNSVAATQGEVYLQESHYYMMNTSESPCSPTFLAVQRERAHLFLGGFGSAEN